MHTLTLTFVLPQSLLAKFNLVDRDGNRTVSDDEWEAIGYYIVFVFQKKGEHVIERWDVGAKPPMFDPKPKNCVINLGLDE